MLPSPDSVHIADIDFADLYGPAFADPATAQDFCNRIEKLQPGRNTAKILMHQAARMIWLGDQIEKRLARGRPAFQVLFYLICAELVGKLVFHFGGEGQSRKYVQRFFGEICTDEHRTRLATAFYYTSREYISWKRAVDFLYEVRCDVVHEGRYTDFHFKPSVESIPYLTGRRELVAEISAQDFRQIVIEGTVLACRRLLSESP